MNPQDPLQPPFQPPHEPPTRPGQGAAQSAPDQSPEHELAKTIPMPWDKPSAYRSINPPRPLEPGSIPPISSGTYQQAAYQTADVEIEQPTAAAALWWGGASILTGALPILGFVMSIVGLAMTLQAKRAGKRFANAAMALVVIGTLLSITSTAAGIYLGTQGKLWFHHKNVPAVTQPASLTNRATYPSEVKSTFISSCTSNGSTEIRCDCLFHYFEKHLPYEKFAAADSEIAQTGNMPDYFKSVLQAANQECGQG